MPAKKLNPCKVTFSLEQAHEAIEAYTQALSIKFDFADTHNNLGLALQAQGKLEEAIEAYKKALSLKPDYVEAHNNMGVALKKQGKLEAAIEAYNNALSLKPDYAVAFNNKGEVLHAQDGGKGQWDRPEKHQCIQRWKPQAH